MELQSKQLSTKGPAGMFSGDVYFDVIAKGEEPSRMRVNTVRFAPCARTASHAHAVGQRRSTSPRASGWSSPAAVSRGRVRRLHTTPGQLAPHEHVPLPANYCELQCPIQDFGISVVVRAE
jgi:hypothetical protein